MAILLKAVCVNIIYQISNVLFGWNGKADPQIYMELQEAPNRQKDPYLTERTQNGSQTET